MGVAASRNRSRTRPGRAAAANGLVQSLGRAIDILEVLAEDDEGFRLIDLAERVGLSPSTTHRLLTTLEQRSFVQSDRTDNLWHIGVGCFAVGATFLRRRNVVAQALPFMRRLRDEAGETVNLGVEQDGEVVFLTQVESREVMRAITRPGGRSAMHCSGMGKALLAAAGDDALAAILRKRGLRRVTPHTIVRPTALRADLEATRRRRYAVDDEENSVGLRCIASAIFDEHEQPFAAVSLAGPKVRLSDERIQALGPTVASIAAEITRALGGRTP
jgi:IclR family transcriptional regulator, acetate operon repressor